MMQGYGLTETCSAGALSDPDDLALETIGPPKQGVHIKLVNWEEGTHQDKEIE